MSALAQVLAKRYAAEECLLFARGSTGLYALFKALREERGPGEVLMPGVCCESVALAAIYAGLEPVFVDVERATCGLAAESVRRNLSASTHAVLAVYLFGIVFDLEPLLELRRRSGFVLIEDLAQAVGGRRAGREVGAAADYTLLSFAADKILKGAGGALVRRVAEGGARLREVARALPAASAPRAREQMAASLRNLTHGLFDLKRAGATLDIAPLFRSALPHYRDLIVRAAPPLEEAPILSQLERLDAERAARHARYAAYRAGIRNRAFRLLELPEGAMCWRCSLLAETPAHAHGVAAALRRAGLHASNHYFPLDLLFDGQAQPENLFVGSRLVNLWVDAAVTAEHVGRTIELINDFRVEDAAWTS